VKRSSIRLAGFSAAALVALSALALGCGSDDASEPQAAAVVNGEVITEGEVAEELSRLPKALQDRYADPAQRGALIDQMIDRRLLLQAAHSRGFDEDPAIRRKVDDLEQRLLVDALQRSLAAEAVGDERVKRYYEDHRAEFTQEQVRVRHILVSDREQAEALAARVAAGEDFAELAKAHSVDPTARRGGDLGYVQKGRMDPAFERAAFALREPGEVSPVVQTRFGFHLIQLIEPPASRVREFEQVRLTIEQKLRREAVEAFLADQRASARIERAAAEPPPRP